MQSYDKKTRLIHFYYKMIEYIYNANVYWHEAVCKQTEYEKKSPHR